MALKPSIVLHDALFGRDVDSVAHTLVLAIEDRILARTFRAAVEEPAPGMKMTLELKLLGNSLYGLEMMGLHVGRKGQDIGSLRHDLSCWRRE